MFVVNDFGLKRFTYKCNMMKFYVVLFYTKQRNETAKCLSTYGVWKNT